MYICIDMTGRMLEDVSMDMQKVVIRNSFGYEDIARAHFLLLARTGREGPC